MGPTESLDAPDADVLRPPHQSTLPHQETAGWTRQWGKFALACSLTLGVITILQITPLSSGRPPIRSRHNDCGANPSTAQARNCKFDILSFAWQTPECFDEETSEAFRIHNGTWSYFSDLEGTPRSEAEAMSGKYTTFVAAEFHRVHCTYMWRQLHRAYAERGYIDEHLESWNHTLHCQLVLLEATGAEAMKEINTMGRVIYPRCKKL
jgi:hypothetical protein